MHLDELFKCLCAIYRSWDAPATPVSSKHTSGNTIGIWVDTIHNQCVGYNCRDHGLKFTLRLQRTWIFKIFAPPRIVLAFCWLLLTVHHIQSLYISNPGAHEFVCAGYASNVYKAQCKHSGVLVCLKCYTLGNLCELNRFQVVYDSCSYVLGGRSVSVVLYDACSYVLRR